MRYNPYANHQPLKVVQEKPGQPINEPTLAGKLEESAMRCHELDSVLSAIAERLYGYQEVHSEAPDHVPANAPSVPHAVEVAELISERLALAVGFARTILSRLGEGR